MPPVRSAQDTLPRAPHRGILSTALAGQLRPIAHPTPITHTHTHTHTHLYTFRVVPPHTCNDHLASTVPRTILRLYLGYTRLYLGYYSAAHVLLLMFLLHLHTAPLRASHLHGCIYPTRMHHAHRPLPRSFAEHCVYAGGAGWVDSPTQWLEMVSWLHGPLDIISLHTYPPLPRERRRPNLCLFGR